MANLEVFYIPQPDFSRDKSSVESYLHILNHLPCSVGHKASFVIAEASGAQENL